MNEKCSQCGMPLMNQGDFHPYAACVMYRQVRQAEKVESHLNQIMDWGRKLERLGLPNSATIVDVARAESSPERHDHE